MMKKILTFNKYYLLFKIYYIESLYSFRVKNLISNERMKTSFDSSHIKK